MDCAYEIAEINRRIDNMIRVGTVVECDYERARARVDVGEQTTGWLPFMAERARDQEISWDAPEPGERVMVLAMSGDLANSCILHGALYCVDHPAPSASSDIITRAHKDGAHDTYDRGAHSRTIQLPDNGELTFLVGDTRITASHDSVTITATDVDVRADNSVTVTANTITLDGEVHLGGTGGEPVARKGDDINTTLKKITKGSDNVFST